MREKRYFIRFDISLKVVYVVQKEIKLEKPGVSRNVSAGGMQLLTSEKLEAGDRIDLKIFVPDGLNPAHIKGLVVWSKEIEPSEGYAYSAGVNFEKIEEDNKNTFLKFLCGMMRGNSEKEKEEQCS